jgi:hypothetical protein
MRKRIRGGAVLQLACVALVGGLVLAACATKIPMQVKRTPTLDTTGIQRVAIMPFGGGYSDAGQYATNKVKGIFPSMAQFTVVGDTTVSEARRRGENLESLVDALFIGQITNVTVNNTSQQGSWKDKDGNVHTYIDYNREVTVSFSYHLERTRDGSMLGPIQKSGRATSSARDDSSRLQSATALTNKIIDDQLKYLNRDLVIYTITVNRVFVDKDPDKTLKEPMKAALAQVKAGSYVAAHKAYLAIWESNQSVAAGINASILYEALGDTQTAANFMQQVVDETGSPKASIRLNELLGELAQAAAVEEFGAAVGQRPSDRVTALAVAEVKKVLPASPKLFIHNNTAAGDNQTLANEVIDNMTASFISDRISVIERQMIDLILKEQNFQLSGNVSDNDIVSIGNLAGANVIVITGIIGQKATRRLTVRVLDIKTGSIIMQSSTGGEWNL